VNKQRSDRNYKSSILKAIGLVAIIGQLQFCVGEAKGSMQTGRLFDSEVEGVEYRTATQSGVTDPGGRFLYFEGETVEFFIGNLSLGSAKGQGMITPANLVNENEDPETQVVNIARLLQSLDSDGKPSNGIRISDKSREKAQKLAQEKIDFKASKIDFDQTLERIVNNLELPKENIVTPDKALEHMTQSIEEKILQDDSLLAVNNNAPIPADLPNAIEELNEILENREDLETDAMEELQAAVFVDPDDHLRDVVKREFRDNYSYNLCAFTRVKADELECVPDSIGCGFSGSPVKPNGKNDKNYVYASFDSCNAACQSLPGENDPNSVFAGTAWGAKYGKCLNTASAGTNNFSDTQPVDLSEDGLNCGTQDALAGCIKPQHSAEYYADQSRKYFETLNSSVALTVYPNYSEKVVRWEWPPWLFLTGLGTWNMIWTDAVQKLYPTGYYKMDCRGFEVQPFGRCHVVFNYDGRECAIYEEFVFNEKGEMTFIEAWTDDKTRMPWDPKADPWAEGPGVERIATKIPGLGNAKGLIDVNSPGMKAAAAADPEIKDFVKRVKSPYYYWFKELSTHFGTNVLDGCDPKKEGSDH
jgi:hypothetical protein